MDLILHNGYSVQYIMSILHLHSTVHRVQYVCALESKNSNYNTPIYLHNPDSGVKNSIYKLLLIVLKQSVPEGLGTYVLCYTLEYLKVLKFYL